MSVPPTDEPVQAVSVRALLLGERLDTRTLERDTALATAPLAVPIKGGGIAVIFRYGAVVLFDGHKTAAQQFLATLDPLVTENSPLPSAKSCSF